MPCLWLFMLGGTAGIMGFLITIWQQRKTKKIPATIFVFGMILGIVWFGIFIKMLDLSFWLAKPPTVLAPILLVLWLLFTLVFFAWVFCRYDIT